MNITVKSPPVVDQEIPNNAFDSELGPFHVASPPVDEETSNSALQDALNTIAARESKGLRDPQQPYITASSAFKADMHARLAQLNAEIAQLEGVRDGLNARIDDMHATRNAVKASLDVLK